MYSFLNNSVVFYAFRYAVIFDNHIIDDNTQIQGVKESIIWFLTLQD